MSTETLRADPCLRRVAAIAVTAIAALGAITLWSLHDWLGNVGPGARSQLLSGLGWIVGVNVIVIAGFALSLWRYGARVRAASQFPPPGARVIRDTPILRGAPAQRRGLILQSLGVAFMLCCVGLAAATWRFYVLFPVR